MHGDELRKLVGLHHIDQVTHLSPLIAIRKGFGVDVSGLTAGRLVKETNVRALERLVQKRDRETVSMAQMPHCWVAASFHHTDQCLVVLMEHQQG